MNAAAKTWHWHPPDDQSSGPNGQKIDSSAPLDLLILAYGNPLRHDDGVGPHIAGQLAHLCPCHTTHQLLPEHAEHLACARRVLFIDASVDLPPAKVRIRRILPQHDQASALTHHVSPQSLLWIAQSLFHHAPHAWTIEIGAADLSIGQGLSTAVARSAAALVRHLRHWTIAKEIPCA